MENIILQQKNKVQFPVLKGWNHNNIKILYISDIHLEQHILDKNLFESILLQDDEITDLIKSKLKKIIADIFGKYLNIINENCYDLILFCGDIADNISLTDLFFVSA